MVGGFFFTRPAQNIFFEVPFPKPNSGRATGQSQTLIMFQQLPPLALHMADHFNQHDAECDVCAPQRQVRAAEAIRSRLSYSPKPQGRYTKANPSGNVSASQRADED